MHVRLGSEGVCGLGKAKAKMMIPMGGQSIRGYYYIEFYAVLSKCPKPKHAACCIDLKHKQTPLCVCPVLTPTLVATSWQV